jgi:hypothetical protein
MLSNNIADALLMSQVKFSPAILNNSLTIYTPLSRMQLGR